MTNETETTELTTFVPATPIAVLTSPEKFDQLLSDIRAAVYALYPQLSWT